MTKRSHSRCVVKGAPLPVPLRKHFIPRSFKSVRGSNQSALSLTFEEGLYPAISKGIWPKRVEIEINSLKCSSKTCAELLENASNSLSELNELLLQKERSLEPKLLRHRFPFALPGLGEAADYCMKVEIKSRCECGESLGTRILKCKRIECPYCYIKWVKEKVFDIALKVEAYATVTGDRPSHVVFSDKPERFKSATWNDYEAFFKKGYRHVSAVGGAGGVRMFHPYRVKKQLLPRLKKMGFGTEKKGFWKAVREDALHLVSLYNYIELGPHAHCLIFPSFLQEHNDKSFFLKKIGVLASLDDVIRLCFYLISHVGILADSEDFDNHPVVFFGELHRFNPSKFLSEKELADLMNCIAEKLNGKIVEGELVFNFDDSVKEQVCKCGAHVSEFEDIHSFASINFKEDEAIVKERIANLPSALRNWWWSLILKYNEKLSDQSLDSEHKRLFLDDISIPSDVAILKIT